MLKRMRSFLVAAMLMVIATVSAQVTTSSMSGKVTAQDEPIIGATVVAIHEPSGTRYGTVTNISGQFNLQGMRTGGPYKVEVSYVGYQTAIYKGVNLSLGEVYTLNVVLKESSELLDEVIVTAQKTVEKMGTVTNVSERQLTTLPTINRSITDFTKLSPYAGGSNSFAGRDGRYNTITVDGAALNNNFGLSTNNLPGGDAQPISLDAIDEISVNVSSGVAAGCCFPVDVLIKSAPEYMDSIEAFLMLEALFNAPVSRITLRWCSLQTSFSSCISSHIPS